MKVEVEQKIILELTGDEALILWNCVGRVSEAQVPGCYSVYTALSASLERAGLKEPGR